MTRIFECPECVYIEDTQYTCTLCWGSKELTDDDAIANDLELEELVEKKTDNSW